MNVLKNRKKAIVYTVLFCVIVTAVAFVAPLLGGSPNNPGPGFIMWAMAPLLTAFVIRIITKEWSDTGIKPAFRKNAVWYAVAVLAFPALTLLSFLIGQVLSVSELSGFPAVSFFHTFLNAIPFFLIFAVFEEFGWRGYLVPKLAATGMNSFLAYAITAAVWATWHLPYFQQLSWVYSSENIAAFVPRFYLAMFAFTIFYNEIRMLTGSVWPAVLAHCIMNSFGHPLAADYVNIVPGSEYIVSSTGLFMILFIGLLGIALNRWRMSVAQCRHGLMHGRVNNQ